MRGAAAVLGALLASCGLNLAGSLGVDGVAPGSDGSIAADGSDSPNGSEGGTCIVPDPNDSSPPKPDAADVQIGPVTCPAGYVAIAGIEGPESKFVATMTTWLAAEQACEAEGTHLATIANQSERDAVLAAVTEDIWIGSSDRMIEGVWRDVTGAPTTYFSWDSSAGEPSTNTEDDCTLLRKTNANGAATKMDAKPCQAPTPHSYICECDGLLAQPGVAF